MEREAHVEKTLPGRAMIDRRFFGFGFLVSGFGFLVSGFQFLVSGFLDFGFPGFGFPVPCFGCSVTGAQLAVVLGRQHGRVLKGQRTENGVASLRYWPR